VPFGRSVLVVGLPYASRNNRLIRAVGMFDDPKLVGYFIVETFVTRCQKF